MGFYGLYRERHGPVPRHIVSFGWDKGNIFFNYVILSGDLIIWLSIYLRIHLFITSIFFKGCSRTAYEDTETEKEACR